MKLDVACLKFTNLHRVLEIALLYSQHETQYEIFTQLLNSSYDSFNPITHLEKEKKEDLTKEINYTMWFILPNILTINNSNPRSRMQEVVRVVAFGEEEML